MMTFRLLTTGFEYQPHSQNVDVFGQCHGSTESYKHPLPWVLIFKCGQYRIIRGGDGGGTGYRAWCVYNQFVQRFAGGLGVRDGDGLLVGPTGPVGGAGYRQANGHGGLVGGRPVIDVDGA